MFVLYPALLVALLWKARLSKQFLWINPVCGNGRKNVHRQKLNLHSFRWPTEGDSSDCGNKVKNKERKGWQITNTCCPWSYRNFIQVNTACFMLYYSQCDSHQSFSHSVCLQASHSNRYSMYSWQCCTIKRPVTQVGSPPHVISQNRNRAIAPWL